MPVAWGAITLASNSPMRISELLEHSIIDPTDAVERRVWILPPADDATTAIVFLDGELYVERVRAPDVLRRLRAEGSIPGGPAFFVAADSGAARHRDFVCRKEYAAFVANEVAGFVRQANPQVGRIVLAGLSLSGLAAAHAATRYSDVFPRVICQSPSLWWERGRFADDLPPAAKPGQEFWICVGNRETESGVSHAPSGLLQELTQVEGCLHCAAALRAKGYGVSYREFDGGHDHACWRDDLALALPWAWREV
jgi:enterochelin esterase-like enzyme